ncbi:SIMPL domain-containing protein [Thalassotalea ponticola]|uniref:SIMPL domain-containing protein n=1 Tax=Thalassotalea ponticola TaxID=1523392 RepID=UPI0025B2948A|nr:SIMPL domain-containing protein [Thalassotalea ponticola]MDN3652739.1 SIMPL domain-containing protein [Thalassotalea ponticola]
MKRFTHIMVALLCILGQPVLHASELNKQGLDVIGRGSVLVDADVYTFSVTIAERDSGADASKRRVDDKAKDIVALATSLGVKDERIETAQMQIRPIYDHRDNSADSLQQPALIEVSRVISFVLDDFSHYDVLLEHAVSLGVQHISALDYQTQKADVYYRQALDLAIIDAQAKATQLANKLGLTLGSVTYIAEMPVRELPKLMATEAAIRKSPVAYHSTPGRLELNAQVSINFALK